jgi:predicted Na+-dependent transporter
MDTEKKGRVALMSISRALLFFFALAVGIPLILGYLSGLPPAQILTLVTSTFILQAAAPPVGLAMGLSTGAILVIMACFALGIVLAIMEICEGLAATSPRMKRWIGNIEKKTQKYPWIQKYGPITCIGIAWIPGVGLYGTPIIAFILGWKKIPSVLFTVIGFLVASIFVIFFANRIQQVFQFAGTVGIILLAIISMLAIGFSLTLPEMHDSLQNRKLLAFSLIANFILVPAMAYLLARILNLSPGLTIGLILVGTAAGSSVLLKLAEVGKGDLDYAKGLMFLLSILSIIYIPLVFPQLIGSTPVNSLNIALLLLLLMLIPLLIGLYVRKERQEFAIRWAPRMSKIATVLLVVVIVVFLALYINEIAQIFRTGELFIIIAIAIIFLLIAFGFGYFLGGKDRSYQRVLGMGTSQRNIAAASAIAFFNFTDHLVILMVLFFGLISLILMNRLSNYLGKKSP